MRGQRVYLSGGHRSGWQDQVIRSCPELEFVDPRIHGLERPELYALWDLHHVRQSDILFGYMESTNPSGIGLALEAGYARALAKAVVIVDERSAQDKRFARDFAIVRSAADVALDSLEEGIEFLASFQR